MWFKSYEPVVRKLPEGVKNRNFGGTPKLYTSFDSIFDDLSPHDKIVMIKRNYDVIITFL